MFQTIDNQYIAINYEGGLYFFEPTSKEWVKITDEEGKVLRTKPEWQVYKEWQNLLRIRGRTFLGIVCQIYKCR